MRLVIDIHHPADINFFKKTIAELRSKNVEIILTALPRGRLTSILRSELPDIKVIEVGKESRKGYIFKIGTWTKRIFQLYAVLRKLDFDLALGFSGVGISHAAFLLGKPSLVFDDDPEYYLGFFSYLPFATKILLPRSIGIAGRKIEKYSGFKELAYLHPKYFQPSEKILEQYQVKPFEYIFVRKVHNNSLNYNHLKEGLIQKTCNELSAAGYKIILSLENKLFETRFENSCIILEEPVADIYSLIYYAFACISSGDTVAREASLLGTPCFYAGGRNMAVNQPLVELGIMQCCQKDLVERIVSLKKESTDWKDKIQAHILNEYDNTTDLILKYISIMLYNKIS